MIIVRLLTISARLKGARNRQYSRKSVLYAVQNKCSECNYKAVRNL